MRFYGGEALRMHKYIQVISIWCFLSACLMRCSTREGDGPSPPKSADEEQATFALENGLNIKLVVAEPIIQDPIVITFDEDGRMWVVEMRGFMPDIDGTGERNPVGRVSILEDSNGDGEMDKHQVYLDSLIMPRAIAIVKGGVLIVEQEALWFAPDGNHDGKADNKELIDPDYAGSKMPEHSGNGLLRGIDNWYYNAKSRFRYKLQNDRWIRDSTEFRGQWGISQDNGGRLYYNYNWSQLHADLVAPNTISRNRHHEPTSGIDYGVATDRRVYPIRDNLAVNRGYIPGTLNAQGRLIEFTAACSPFYYRGAAFDKAHEENVYVCEPSGNLVKRNIIAREGVYVKASDPHPGTEFLASTDERFRPVFITSGPDGALYLADMYRGLIQHGAYVTPYLREQTLSRNLDKPVNCGRIWRISPNGFKTIKPEKLSTATTDRLIELLGHANGWYRDMAQRLLVERNDRTAISKLRDVAADDSKNSLARLHALWTLEGVDGIALEQLLQLINDREDAIRIAALRMLELKAPLGAGMNERIAIALNEFADHNQTGALQSALTSHVLPATDRLPILRKVLVHFDTSALLRDAVLSSAEGLELNLAKSLIQGSEWKSASPSRQIVLEMLTAAVLRERDPAKVASLMSLVREDMTWTSQTILTAMAAQGQSARKNPITLASEPKILRLLNVAGSRLSTDADLSKEDATLRDHLQTIQSSFAWPGHAPAPMAHDSATQLSDADAEQFVLGRKHYLATCAGCHGTDGMGMKRMAPPLAGSEWVLGDQKRLALIILHGLEGAVEVNHHRYDSPEILTVMPSHATMDDGAIRAVMTYIRNEWGNHAPPINGRVVGRTRHTSQGRVQPWTPRELNEFIEQNPDTPEPSN